MKTNIQYADEVSNPLFARPIGDESVKVGTFCEKPDAAGTCQNCWAEVLNLRFGNKLTFDKANRHLIEWVKREKEMNRLLMRNSQKARSSKFAGLPLVVFCCDTFDIFQPSISDDLRDWVFDDYDQCTNLTLLVQTTYPARMNHYFRARYGRDDLPVHYFIGMSAGTQEFYERNLDYLLDVDAARHYVIFEPLLERIELTHGSGFLDLIIIGGESVGARPCDVNWIRSLVRQCRELGIAPFVKQLGTSSTLDGSPYLRITSKKGGDVSEFPADLQIREFPTLL